MISIGEALPGLDGPVVVLSGRHGEMVQTDRAEGSDETMEMKGRSRPMTFCWR